MKVIKATQQMLETRTLVLGFQGENLRTQLRIDCSPTFAEYPNATPALAVKPSSGETYPVFVERDGNEVVWDIVANNLVLKGDGELQLTFYKDNVIAKTVIGTIRVNRSLQIDGEMPDVVATWIENANRKLAEVDAQIVELEGMVDTATDAATRAEQSASTASTKAEQAAGSAATATAKANEATQAAGTATAKATEAEQSAQTATQKATAAADSERIATAKAVEATTAAGTATAKAEQATEAAQTATEKAADASASATAAQTSATNAASSATAAQAAQTAAKASETAASTSASQAAQSAQTASTAAQTATQKAADASASATNAAASATSAATSAETASTKAGEAAQSAQAVAETAEQLAESLEQIDQNTQDIAELDERKANIDGYYPDMTVGNAEQLNSSKFVENSEPYTFRTSGGSADIGNREYVDAVVGGTLAWNQAVRDEASENQTDFAPIVTVTDAVEDAAGVKVKIEPVQDLHGYDHPWPAGGGKNLMPAPTSVEVNGTDLRVVNNNGQLTINGNAHSSDFILVRIEPITISEGYILAFLNSFVNSNVYFLNGTTSVDYFSASTTNRVVNTSSMATLYGKTFNVYRILFSSDQTLTNASFALMAVADGADTTTFAPYSNICPITGWDGVKVTRTGKNLLDNANPVYLNGYFNNATVLANNNNRILIVPCAPNTAYAFTYNRVAISGTQTARIVSFESLPTYGMDGTKMAVSVNESASATFTTGANDKYIGIHLGDIRSTDVSASVNASQLEIGSTATDYEPYAGTTYDITLPTEAGTVYGGELTVNEDGTGTLVVDIEKRRVLASFNWYNGYGGFYAQVNSMKRGTNMPGLCSHLKTYSSSTIGTDLYIRFGNNDQFIYFGNVKNVITDLSGWKSFLNENEVQIAYPLATPLTYTLTASQVTTLLGTNNVWSDTGDLALTYTGTDEHLTLESGKKYLSRISGTDSMLLGSGQEITAAKGTDNVFDLTQMFGTAVADYVYGQGAAFFRKWFPNAVYPYNAGELKHVEGLQSHDMVGFNLWDEEWEIGGIDYTTGENTVFPSYSRSKNYIAIIPSLSYYFKKPQGVVTYLFFYDCDKNFISRTDPFATAGAGGTFAIPSNAYFMRFSNYRNTYKHDICINLAHNGSRKGEYEPYEKHSYPLDSSVILRGIPKVDSNGVYWDGDRYLPDGTVERRYGVVDLGTQAWVRRSEWSDRNVFEIPLLLGTRGITYMVCPMYSLWTEERSTAPNKTIFKGNTFDSYTLMIRDDVYTDAASFRVAMQGVLLVYELATPTTETAQPYHSTQWVSDWGTEKFVSTSIVPVGTETRYPANLRDKLQHLPDAASGNGSYLITQTDGQMVLTPFPAPPSSAGNYVLKATVVNGVATYTWEVAT